MTPIEKHRETAREELMRALTASRAKSADAGIEIIAAALAKSEREGMKRAAEIVLRFASNEANHAGYVLSSAVAAIRLEAGEGA